MLNNNTIYNNKEEKFLENISFVKLSQNISNSSLLTFIIILLSDMQ